MLLECVIGGGIKGVFDMGAEACVLFIIRIAEQCGPLALGIVGSQFVYK